MAAAKHLCGFEGLLVHSWVQTFTDECRALCKHPRGNGAAQHLLEDPQVNAHTRDWSKLVDVHERTTGLSVRRWDGRN